MSNQPPQGSGGTSASSGENKMTKTPENNTPPGCCGKRPCRKKEGTFATATKYVIITKKNIEQEVQPGDHLAYTMSLCGITYWHEFLVASCNWEAGTLTVYERVRVPEKGFRKSDFWINNLWDQEKLCKKYIYGEKQICKIISLERAEKLFLKEEKIRKKKKEIKERSHVTFSSWDCDMYNVIGKNCEHTVRGLKTGKQESVQCKECCNNVIIKEILLFLIKLWKIICLVSIYGGRPLLYMVLEFFADNCSLFRKNSDTCRNFTEKFDGFTIGHPFTIGIELILAFLLNLIWWLVWEIRICYKFSEKKRPFWKACLCCNICKVDDLKKDNYKDECKIMRYDMAGSFIGTLFVIAIAFGLHQIPCNDIFLLVIESVLFLVVTFFFSAIGKNIGLSKVREKHKKYWEKKQSTQQKPKKTIYVACICCLKGDHHDALSIPDCCCYCA